MSHVSRPTTEEVEQLLRNAQLRNELEPYIDESVDLVDIRRLPTRAENEFLASMLAWERAPVLPISRWFEPELVLPPPETLDERALHERLWNAIHQLYQHRIVLQYTEHLSDRQLYCVLFRDILPAEEKKLDLPRSYLHFHCLDVDDDPVTWLRYYATEEERRNWHQEHDGDLPASQPPPFPRKMPRRPLE